MSSSNLPAILGGTPVVAAHDEPAWPPVGLIESAVLAEITERGEWFAHTHVPGKWRAILEQVVADTTGYRYGVAPWRSAAVCARSCSSAATPGPRGATRSSSPT
jgi:hypothetical protein